MQAKDITNWCKSQLTALNLPFIAAPRHQSPCSTQKTSRYQSVVRRCVQARRATCCCGLSAAEQTSKPVISDAESVTERGDGMSAGAPLSGFDAAHAAASAAAAPDTCSCSWDTITKQLVWGALAVTLAGFSPDIIGGVAPSVPVSAAAAPGRPAWLVSQSTCAPQNCFVGSHRMDQLPGVVQCAS